METLTVICEPLTSEEEIDFVDAINAAVERGDLTQDEAVALIDREFDLQGK